MSLYQVSVIVLTYKPKLSKLLYTLNSILKQKDINFEIIISDDGSDNNYFINIREACTRNNFTKVKFLEHQNNVGTVKNYYEAMLLSKGEYIYGISPGDVLYNDTTLKDIYNFAKTKNAKICFGNTIYYSLDNGKCKIVMGANNPKKPQFYNEEVPLKEQKFFFFLGNMITGPSFLREREFALYYFHKILRLARYVEDNTSTAFALADGHRIYHYDEYIVWYEYGCGISTSENKKWQNLIQKDFDVCFYQLRKEYPNDYIISKYIPIYKHNKILKIVLLLIRAPDLLFKALKFKLSKSMKICQKPFDKKKLLKIISDGGKYASN